MKHGFRKWLVFVLFLLLEIISLQKIVRERSRASLLEGQVWTREDFLSQDLSTDLYEQILEKVEEGADFGELLAATMLNGDFSPTEVSTDSAVFRKYKTKEYVQMKNCLEAVWADLEFFPVASDEISFEDSYGAVRNYGGERLHEGCDLFGSRDMAGYYPVVSMTDGVVEKIGWLPLGGYRIGIRSPSGGYFYYAHLSGYEQDFSVGEQVSAGDILGYMGDTGYGTEGTRGKFPVHLHLGIYIQTPENAEQSVNPYHVLLAVSAKIRNFRYYCETLTSG